MGEQTVEVIVNGEGVLTIGLHVGKPVSIEGEEPQPGASDATDEGMEMTKGW